MNKNAFISSLSDQHCHSSVTFHFSLSHQINIISSTFIIFNTLSNMDCLLLFMPENEKIFVGPLSEGKLFFNYFSFHLLQLRFDSLMTLVSIMEKSCFVETLIYCFYLFLSPICFYFSTFNISLAEFSQLLTILSW